VIGISVSEQGYDSDKRFRRSAACIAGLRHAVTRLLGLDGFNIGAKPPHCLKTDN
jgi:hypothetical protein